MGCNVVEVTKLEDDTQSDSIRFSKEYPEVSYENPFKYATYENVVDIIQNGTGIIYLGYPSCIYCDEVAQTLNEVAKEKKIKEIFYYNFRDIKTNNTKEYKKLVDLLSENLNSEDNQIVSPSLVFVVNGKIKGIHSKTVDSHNARERKMTEEEKNSLKQIYSDYIDQVYNDNCDC